MYREFSHRILSYRRCFGQREASADHAPLLGEAHPRPPEKDPVEGTDLRAVEHPVRPCLSRRYPYKKQYVAYYVLFCDINEQQDWG